jgi:hypothetical protein
VAEGRQKQEETCTTIIIVVTAPSRDLSFLG